MTRNVMILCFHKNDIFKMTLEALFMPFTMAASASQTVLGQRLSALLGFEDGANDVLDHLLSIESSQDLTDYLSQLLGRNDEEVQKFVEDVCRFQRGEALSDPTGDAAQDDAKPAAKPSVERTYEAKVKAQKADRPTKEPAHTVFGHSIARKSSSAAPAKKAATHPAQSAGKPNASSNAQPKQTVAPPIVSKPLVVSKEDSVTTKSPPPKSRPPKGKASVVCGCYGSLHKPLTNCLYCGRISCEREGYDFCPFCGVLVEQVTDEGGKKGSKAWEHKERLLRFDRDFARRTVVLDDQADFFTSNKSWLTEEERIAAEEKQAEQKEKLRTREKQTLDIAF